jgi:hypothetical protein
VFKKFKKVKIRKKMAFDYVTDQNHETLQALVTTEGILFQDELVKKFYLIIKYYTIEIFENIHNIYIGKQDEYLKILQTYETFIDKESLLKKHASIEMDLSDTVILYTKYIFKKDIIRLKRPSLDAFLKGFFHKFVQFKALKNGTFFTSSLIEQDFIFRDIFRQTLFMDCIKVIERKVAAPYANSVLPAYSVLTHATPYPTLKKLEKLEPTESIKSEVNSEDEEEPEKEQDLDLEKVLPATTSSLSEPFVINPPAPSVILKQMIDEEKTRPTEFLESSTKNENELEKNNLDFNLSDEEITEDDSISRVMEKMYIESIQKTSESVVGQKKIKKILL